jgi:DNA invertase Pin-like site-specific DNA recombinase
MMSKRAALYARVSDERQDQGEAASIDQQLAEMKKLCQREGYSIVGTFVDSTNYRATQNPRRGKIVNPSGERADRPQFLQLLEMVRAGTVDVVLCWRDDRLMRHPRVGVALEDALDVGDAQRAGKPKIEIRDATGAVLDRFTLSIKASVWLSYHQGTGQARQSHRLGR